MLKRVAYGVPVPADCRSSVGESLLDLIGEVQRASRRRRRRSHRCRVVCSAVAAAVVALFAARVFIFETTIAYRHITIA